jgi:hypothetical protein
MKTIYKSILTCLLIIYISSAGAQGWNQGRTGIYSAGIGSASAIFIPVYDYPGYGWSSRGISFNISREYAVHRVVGIGWLTGLNVFTPGRYYHENDDQYYSANSVGIPMGFKLNVHILEAANARIKDDLDVYAGFNVGGGPSFHNDPYGGVYPFFFAGPQVGIRYWFTPNIGIFTELGWGATAFNMGVSF